MNGSNNASLDTDNHSSESHGSNYQDANDHNRDLHGDNEC